MTTIYKGEGPANGAVTNGDRVREALRLIREEGLSVARATIKAGAPSAKTVRRLAKGAGLLDDEGNVKTNSNRRARTT